MKQNKFPRILTKADEDSSGENVKVKRKFWGNRAVF